MRIRINRLSGNCLCLVLFVPFFLVSSLQAQENTYFLNTETSFIKWEGKKVVGSHEGTVRLTSGKITVSGEEIRGGHFVINMQSIVNTDLESEEWRSKLEQHLKSDDFFSVNTYPEAVFEVREVKRIVETAKPDDYLISGQLTVKGIAKPLSFPAVITKKDGIFTASAKFEFNRLDWGIKYNSGKFFDVNKLGDKLIYDQVGIELNLETLTGAKN